MPAHCPALLIDGALDNKMSVCMTLLLHAINVFHS
jgi:hypothetical protein